MKLEFLEIPHEYRADGQKMGGVTTILRAVGLSGKFEFRNPIHSLRGRAVHEAAAIVVAGGKAVIHPLPPPDKFAVMFPGKKYEDYVQVHAELPGYVEAVYRAKEALKFIGCIYECRFIDVPSRLGGTLDCMAYARMLMEQLWDWKSGSYPHMTIVQMCGYEHLARSGQPIDPEHPGLPWLKDLVQSGRKFERCGLRIEKTGRFTAYFECPKGRSYNDPLWMNVWRSALFLYNNVPEHEYVEQDDMGHVYKKSHLSDSKWIVEQAREKLKGPVLDLVLRAGENVWTIRERYGLL